MSFRCNNGTPHTHETVAESRDCWGHNTSAKAAREHENIIKWHHPSAPLGAPYTPALEARATARQLAFIRDLGGDADNAAQYSIKEASNYIKQLQAARAIERTAPAPPLRSGSLAITQPSRLEQVLPLLEVVPDGYFAVQSDTDKPLAFVRISTVKRKDSPQHGWRRVQTIHGPSMDLAAAVSPAGRVREYKSGVDDLVLLVIADFRGAALRYAKEIGKCCRCNTRLTDERSRHYGIGPECEQHWPWVITLVDEQRGE